MSVANKVLSQYDDKFNLRKRGKKEIKCSIGKEEYCIDLENSIVDLFTGSGVIEFYLYEIYKSHQEKEDSLVMDLVIKGSNINQDEVYIEEGIASLDVYNLKGGESFGVTYNLDNVDFHLYEDDQLTIKLKLT